MVVCIFNYIPADSGENFPHFLNKYGAASFKGGQDPPLITLSISSTKRGQLRGKIKIKNKH